MRAIIWVLLIPLLGAVGFSLAQDAADKSEPTVSGMVYRCNMPDGSRVYTRKPAAGAECVAISYRLNPNGDKAPNPGVPNGWTYLTSSATSDVYVQTSAIIRKSGAVGVWVMDNYKSPQMANSARTSFLSSLRRLSINCDGHQVSVLKITYASQPFGRGEYVGEWRPLGGYSDFATPGSIDDAIAAYVCRTK